MMNNLDEFEWIREPKTWKKNGNMLTMATIPHTDLWQRTYYHFRNDNAPCFQMKTEKDFFSFTVKTSFKAACHRFDQCGIVLYLDGENWLKASVEFETERMSHLGSVVTDGGFSDWATTELDGSVKQMWYRLSRRGNDFRIECSRDGTRYAQMRICHMRKASGDVSFGIYACSPEDSSFTARFSHFAFGECLWEAHDGQQPDD